MEIGCGTVVFRTFPLEKALEAIRAAGFEYFETQAVGPWCPHVDIDKDDPVKFAALAPKYGFKGITGLWMRDGNIIANQNSVASGIRSVEWAAAAGIPVVHTGDGGKPKGMSDEEAFSTFSERIALILEAAKARGVIVALEPHGAFSLTKTGLNRLLSLGTPDVLGVNFDAANIHRAAYVESGNGKSGYRQLENHEKEDDILESVIGRVVHMHAKDLSDDCKRCVPLGEGCVDLKDCIAILKKHGYGGVLSLETEGGMEWDETVELVRKSYAYLKAAQV